MNLDEPPHEEPSRRWPQFSLRTIFVLTTAAAIIAALAAGVFGMAVAQITWICLIYLAAILVYAIFISGLVFTSVVIDCLLRKRFRKESLKGTQRRD
jgi:hypothetical protein